MEIVIITCCVTAGIVLMTFLVTKKNVKKHITEVSLGKIFQIKTETEFSKDA